jgi:ribonuclease E
VESQLDAMFSPTVQLRSGGYIVINQTEALVSIDVNSGRSTREHHIEDTALKTNLEASEEVARQLRLRDLAGLIVIDFIDMDEKRNNRSVERKMSECLRHDRARIQVGRISHFGLLEMSRQRIRASVLESSTEPCPHCGGTGHVRSVSSVALQLLRSLEETLMKGATHNLTIRTRTDVALYVLNHKRGHLRDLENSFKVQLTVVADVSLPGQQAFVIDRGEQVHTLEAAKALLAAQVVTPLAPTEPFDPAEAGEEEFETVSEEIELVSEVPTTEEGDALDGDRKRRGRRRRRRGGRGEPREALPASEQDGDAVAIATSEEDSEDEGAEAEETAEGGHELVASTDGDNGADGERRRRRRGRRGGRRRRRDEDEVIAGEGQADGGVAGEGLAGEGLAASIADDLATTVPREAETEAAVANLDRPPERPLADYRAPAPQSAAPLQAADTSEASDSDSSEKSRRRSTVREKVSFGVSESAPSTPAENPAQPTAEATPTASTATTERPADEATPRRAGWWSRRFGNGD